MKSGNFPRIEEENAWGNACVNSGVALFLSDLFLGEAQNLKKTSTTFSRFGSRESLDKKRTDLLLARLWAA